MAGNRPEEYRIRNADERASDERATRRSTATHSHATKPTSQSAPRAPAGRIRPGPESPLAAARTTRDYRGRESLGLLPDATGSRWATGNAADRLAPGPVHRALHNA